MGGFIYVYVCGVCVFGLKAIKTKNGIWSTFVNITAPMRIFMIFNGVSGYIAIMSLFLPFQNNAGVERMKE